MTADEIAKLRALAEAATRGPWISQVQLEDDGSEEWRVSTSVSHCIVAQTGSYPTGEPDSKYIAAANPTVVLGLLDEIGRLQSELDAMCANDSFKLEEIKRLRADEATMKLSRMLGLGDPVRPDIHAKVCRQRDLARADCERMRPVFEAAFWWRDTMDWDASRALGERFTCETKLVEAIDGAFPPPSDETLQPFRDALKRSPNGE